MAGERAGRLLVTPRTLGDYRDMFALDDGDLAAGPILDCPGGASSFGAQARVRGATVLSVDPAYALHRGVLLDRIRADIAHTAAWTSAQEETIGWSYVGTPGSMRRAFEVAADLFAADIAAHPDRYVAASPPALPFPDRVFRLALCSHLLFSYPEYLGFDAHLASLRELLRVTTDEVRVYPLVDTAATPYPRLGDLRAALEGGPSSPRSDGSRHSGTAAATRCSSAGPSGRWVVSGPPRAHSGGINERHESTPGIRSWHCHFRTPDLAGPRPVPAVAGSDQRGTARRTDNDPCRRTRHRPGSGQPAQARQTRRGRAERSTVGRRRRMTSSVSAIPPTARVQMLSAVVDWLAAGIRLLWSRRPRWSLDSSAERPSAGRPRKSSA